MDRLMTVKEAAEYLKLSPITVYKLAQKSRLPASKVGGNWRFKKEFLDSWLSQQARMPRESVLVVDDDPRVRDLLLDVISEQGYQAVAAESGDKALEELRRQHFSLVFLDLVLPGTGGLEVLRAIKSQFKKTMVAIVTGYGDDPIALEAMAEGPMLLIRKPFKVDDIVQVLNMQVRTGP